MKTVLTLICLALLSACSTTKPVPKTIVTEYIVVNNPIPEWMTKRVDKPPLKGHKFKDLAALAVSLDRALQQCNLQLSSIVDFEEKQKPSTVDENKKRGKSPL